MSSSNEDNAADIVWQSVFSDPDLDPPVDPAPTAAHDADTPPIEAAPTPTANNWPAPQPPLHTTVTATDDTAVQPTTPGPTFAPAAPTPPPPRPPAPLTATPMPSPPPTGSPAPTHTKATTAGGRGLVKKAGGALVALLAVGGGAFATLREGGSVCDTLGSELGEAVPVPSSNGGTSPFDDVCGDPAAPSTDEAAGSTDQPTDVQLTTTVPTDQADTGTATTASSTSTSFVTTPLPSPPAQLAYTYPGLINDTATDNSMGSGCTPGSGPLPDGVWFGIVVAWSTSTIEFDLTCAYTGLARQQAAQPFGDILTKPIYVVNTVNTTRNLAVSPDATGRALTQGSPGSATPMADFLAQVDAAGSIAPYNVWVYVNNGAVTETVMQNETGIQFASSGSQSNCSTAQLPSSNQLAVTGISATDPDKGLNVRQGPSTQSPILTTAPNGTAFTFAGGCETTATGSVWWEISGQGITGWANSTYLG